MKSFDDNKIEINCVTKTVTLNRCEIKGKTFPCNVVLIDTIYLEINYYFN